MEWESKNKNVKIHPKNRKRDICSWFSWRKLSKRVVYKNTTQGREGVPSLHLTGTVCYLSWRGQVFIWFTAPLLFFLEFLTKSDHKNCCGSLGWQEIRLVSCNLIKLTENANSYHVYASFLFYINWFPFKQNSQAIPRITQKTQTKPNTDMGTNR